MPVEEGLVITISADASQVGKGLKDLQGQLKRFQDAQKGISAGAAGYDRLGRAVVETERRIKALTAAQNAANKSLVQGGAAAAKGGRDYTNFSRVLQDLPFGLVAIQNNLTQLIPGVGLLGLAFSGLIAAVTFSQVGFGAWTRGLSDSKKEIDETKKRLEELIKPLDEIRDAAASGATGEVATVQALANIVKDQTRSYEDRNAALKQLGVINKSYFGDLTLEESKLKVLTARVDEYTKALISKAVVNAFSEDIGKLTVELSRQQTNLGKTVAQLNKYSQAAKQAQQESNQLQQQIIGGSTVGTPRLDNSAVNATRQLEAAKKNFDEQKGLVSQIFNQKSELETALQQAVNESLKFKPLTTPTGGGTTEKQKTEFLFNFFPFDPSGKLKPEQRAQLLDALDKFNKEFGTVFQGVDFRAQSANEEGALQSARDWWAAYQKGIFQFNPKTFSVDLNIEPPASVAEDFGEKIQRSINQGLAGFDPVEDLGIFSDKSVTEALAAWNKEMDKAREKAMNYATTISGILTPALQGMFQAVVQGANPLKAFFSAIGQAIQQLIGKLIAAAIQAAILNALLPGGFSVGGSMVKGFGNIFKNLLGFAQGAVVSGPVMAMVGEGRGTSKSNPEIVAPLDKLKNMIGGGGGNFPAYLPVHEISGDTLRLWYQRANASGRRFG